MKVQPYTLDQVLGEQKRVFLDRNIYLPQGIGNWYGKIVYNRQFHELDKDLLLEVNDSLKQEITLWYQPTTFSTEKVVEEIRIFNQILQERLDYFRRNLKRRRSKSGGIPPTVNGHPFLRVCNNHATILQAATSSLYKPRNQDVFEVLEDLVISVGRETSAKIDFSKRHGNRKRNNVDLHTDEQVVAAAIYSSVVENTPCAIVTPDSDHQRLLAGVQRYAHKTDIHLGSKSLSEALLEHSVQVYFVEDENKVWCRADTANHQISNR